MFNSPQSTISREKLLVLVNFDIFGSLQFNETSVEIERFSKFKFDQEIFLLLDGVLRIKCSELKMISLAKIEDLENFPFLNNLIGAEIIESPLISNPVYSSKVHTNSSMLACFFPYPASKNL